MRFCTIGSGSRGNATIIDSGQTRLLLDCGFPARELESRAKALGFDIESLDAILVTHEHADHINGVGAVARRYNLGVYASHGTYRSGKFGRLPEFNKINLHAGLFSIGDIAIQPVAVPHDAREPCQFVFTCGEVRLGILTDLGCITPSIIKAFQKLDLLLLEANHDEDMLKDGPYPPSLQARVGGKLGHLNNTQAMDFLKQIDHDLLRRLVLGHLSEKNNHPERVVESIDEHLPPLSDRFDILRQDEVSGWFS